MTDELDALLADAPLAPPTLNVATERKCRRHRWLHIAGGVDTNDGEGPLTLIPDRWECMNCGKPKDEARSRRGRTSRNRGNAIEREVAAQLGLRRVGQYGGPSDVEGDYLVIQVKSGSGFPERTWRWLHAMTANANQTRAVVLTDAPGPGHKRRALICVTLEDWIALHGGTDSGEAA